MKSEEEMSTGQRGGGGERSDEKERGDVRESV